MSLIINWYYFLVFYCLVDDKYCKFKEVVIFKGEDVNSFYGEYLNKK